MKLFENLKVVEFASVLAGPLVGSFFAELGAKVIKIENSNTEGDVTRKWKLPSEDSLSSFSAYYASANYGKSSIFLDLTHESDYQIVCDMVKSADIVLVNFKPGDAVKLKLDFSTLLALNPTIIYAELTGFGSEDARSAFDVVLQAETGYMSMNGEKDSKPLKMPLAFIDILAAHQLKEGILFALIQRQQTMVGRKVSVSLYDAAISSLANQASNYLMTHSIPKRMGSEHPNIAPYGDLLQTADGAWFVLAIGTDRQFMDFCTVLNLSNLHNSDKFKTNSARVIHRQELIILISASLIHKNAEELEGMLKSKNIPYGRVLNMDEVFDNKQAQRLIIEDEIDGMKARRVKTVVFNLD